jgi:hypothetical protein
MSSGMTIRVVAFKEGDHFVAQALEVDVCAQGRTLDEAHSRLLMTIKSEEADALAEGRTLMDIGPAPHPFHLLFRDEDIERTELKVA